VIEPLPVFRPLTRGECVDGPRPCPWASCRHHLYLEVSEVGSVRVNFPDVDPGRFDLLPETCALDVADRGGTTLEDVGAALNVSRQYILQSEWRSIRRIQRGSVFAQFADEIRRRRAKTPSPAAPRRQVRA